MTKLCQKLKWLYLPVALLVFGLFGLGVKQSNAAYTFDDSSISFAGGNITIATSTENVAMFCTNAWATSLSFTVGAKNSINILNGGVDGTTISLAYILEPPSGTTSWTLNSSDPYNDLDCWLVGNIDTTVAPTITLIGGIGAWGDRDSGSTLTINRVNENDYLILSSGGYYSCGGGATNASSTILTTSPCNSNWKRNRLFLTESNLTQPINQVFDFGTTAAVLFYYLDLTEKSEPGPKVYWAGVGSQYGEWYKTMKIPVYWNVCEDYDNINRATIELNEGEGLGETEIIQDKSVFIGPQKCSGISYIEIDGNTVRNWWQAGTTTSTIAMDLFKADSTDTIISSEFNLLISNGINASNFIDSSIVSPLVIASTTGTTTIPFTYNVTGLNVDEICAYNTKTNTILDICQTITEDSGITSMNWPNSATYQSLYLKYVGLDSNDNIKIMSDQFNIIFNGITDNPYLNPDASSSIFSFFNKQPSEVACSDAMWEKASTSDAFFNFTELYCDAMTGMITTIDTMGSFIVKGIQEIGTTLSHLFPINVAVKIKSSWDNSASSTLPTDLAWINEDIDENGNIYLDNIEGEGMATGTQIILGSNIMGDNEFPNKIKSLSKYIMIGLFFEFSVILRGKKVYESLKQEI